MAITIGAFLNAIGILFGAIVGMVRGKSLSLPLQIFFRNGIGAFTIFFGVRLIYLSINGAFLSCLKQAFCAFLAVVLGFWVGKLFRLQKISNRLGRLGANAILAAQKNAHTAADGFNACAVLFCAEPLGMIGAVTDGVSNYFYLLAVKAVMDAMAMTDFVRVFRWPSALSAIPVFLFLSAISMAVQFYIRPALTQPQLDAINAAAGLMACIVTIVIFGAGKIKVELVNYMPALVVAPLLAKWIH